MPGEFYIDNPKLKLDLSEIRKSLEQIKVITLENQAKLGKILSTLDIWGPIQSQLSLTSNYADLSLPGITIKSLPPAATIIRTVLMFKYRVLENTNGDQNSLAQTQDIQILNEADGEWETTIRFQNGDCSIPGLTRESGDVVIGTEDISFRVPDNEGSLLVQWSGSLAARDTLNYVDIQAGLRIWFSV